MCLEEEEEGGGGLSVTDTHPPCVPAAFDYPAFVDSIKQWYWDSIGDAPRGDGSLNPYQLRIFIGRLLKEAYRSGLMPKAAFFDDGSLSEADIQEMLERRARDMLHGYFSANSSKTSKFFWEDLLPVVKAFYISMWNQERPEVSTLWEAVCLCWCGVDVDASARVHGVCLALFQDADAELDYEGEEEKGVEHVDYGHGTLAEAGLTKETGSAMVQSTLPPDWAAVIDPASGQLYYVNAVTGDTSWEPPGGYDAYEV